MPISSPTSWFPDVFPVNSGSAASGSSVNAPANALVFGNIITTGANDSFSSVVDGGGNSYGVTITTTDASNAAICLIYAVLPSLLGSGATLTATTSDGSQWGIGEGFYVTGATGGIDKFGSTNFDGSNTGTSLSLSTGLMGSSSEIIVCCFNTSGANTTWTEAAGFSTLHNDGFNITSYKIVSSNVSVTWNPTFTATGPYNAVLATFKATPAASASVASQFTAAPGIIQVVTAIGY